MGRGNYWDFVQDSDDGEDEVCFDECVCVDGVGGDCGDCAVGEEFAGFGDDVAGGRGRALYDWVRVLFVEALAVFAHDLAFVCFGGDDLSFLLRPLVCDVR